MALTVLVTVYVMTLKQIEAESVLHPAVAIALLTSHLVTFLRHTCFQEHPSFHKFQIQESQRVEPRNQQTVTPTI